MYLETFSERLKELMDWEDVSITALSKAIDVERKSVRGWLQGKYFPRYDALMKLATYFHTSLDFLVGLEEQDSQGTLNLSVAVSTEEIQASFLEKLKLFMATERKTIYAVAKGVDMDQKCVKNWLVKGSMPDTLALIKLSRMMGCSLDSLLGRK